MLLFALSKFSMFFSVTKLGSGPPQYRVSILFHFWEDISGSTLSTSLNIRAISEFGVSSKFEIMQNLSNSVTAILQSCFGCCIILNSELAQTQSGLDVIPMHRDKSPWTVPSPHMEMWPGGCFTNISQAL